MIIASILIACSAILIFLAVQLVAWRVLPSRHRDTTSMALIACAGYALSAFLARALFALPAIEHIPVSAPVFLFFGVLYFHFYFGVDRSVSMRTIGELAQSEGSRLSMAELAKCYSQEEMIRRRLGIMVQHGWLSVQDGVYDCTAKSLTIGKVAQFAGRLYNVDASG